MRQLLNQSQAKQTLIVTCFPRLTRGTIFLQMWLVHNLLYFAVIYLQSCNRTVTRANHLTCKSSQLNPLITMLITTTRFVLFWAFEIPWLCITFCMISPGFPWYMLSRSSQKIVKRIYSLRYFLTLWRNETRVSVYFVLELTGFLTCLLFMPVHSHKGLENEIIKFYEFPGFPWTIRTLQSQ